MNRRETRSDTIKRMQDLKEGQAIGYSTPLKNHLKPDEFAGISYYDYLRNLEKGRVKEKNGGNPNNGSDQPKS